MKHEIVYRATGVIVEYAATITQHGDVAIDPLPPLVYLEGADIHIYCNTCQDVLRSGEDHDGVSLSSEWDVV